MAGLEYKMISYLIFVPVQRDVLCKDSMLIFSVFSEIWPLRFSGGKKFKNNVFLNLSNFKGYVAECTIYWIL